VPSYASVKNSAGNYIKPTLDGAAAAVSNAKFETDLTYSPINAAGDDSYPITSPTWIIAYKNQTDQAKGDALKAFLNFILTDGQQLANQAGYAPLPSEVAQKAITQLDQFKIG